MSCLFCPLQEEEVGNTIDSETRRKHFYQIEKSLVVSAILKLSFCYTGTHTDCIWLILGNRGCSLDSGVIIVPGGRDFDVFNIK